MNEIRNLCFLVSQDKVVGASHLVNNRRTSITLGVIYSILVVIKPLGYYRTNIRSHVDSKFDADENKSANKTIAN